MVLVDPTPPNEEAEALRLAPDIWLKDPEQSPFVQFIRKCIADLRSGAEKLGGPDPDGCFRYPPSWPPEFVQAFAANLGDPVLRYATMASFSTVQGEDSRIAVNPKRNYGDMPLVVLTATEKYITPPGASAAVRAQGAALDTAHNEDDDAYAALSTRGINARVPGANHDIQLSKPQAVIDAVNMVVREARQRVRK
jgi:pimeloyl-ACP methyl ester carboxylesterase